MSSVTNSWNDNETGPQRNKQKTQNKVSANEVTSVLKSIREQGLSGIESLVATCESIGIELATNEARGSKCKCQLVFEDGEIFEVEIDQVVLKR